MDASHSLISELENAIESGSKDKRVDTRAMRRRLLPRTAGALWLLPLPRRRRKTGAHDDLGPQNRNEPA
jgi:hypothetical protein